MKLNHSLTLISNHTTVGLFTTGRQRQRKNLVYHGFNLLAQVSELLRRLPSILKVIWDIGDKESCIVISVLIYLREEKLLYSFSTNQTCIVLCRAWHKTPRLWLRHYQLWPNSCPVRQGGCGTHLVAPHSSGLISTLKSIPSSSKLHLLQTFSEDHQIRCLLACPCPSEAGGPPRAVHIHSAAGSSLKICLSGEWPMAFTIQNQ